VTTDLSDWTDSLRRTVARPGEFARFFPNTTDNDLVGTLLDGLGDAQLDGFLVGPVMYVADDDGIVTPELSRPQAALIVLYGGRLFLRAELANRRNRIKYAARGNEADTEQSASVITELLKSAEARIVDLRNRQRLAGNAGAFVMADAYLVKAIGYPTSSELALAEASYDAIWDPGPFIGG
jgi:hypothetical protein